MDTDTARKLNELTCAFYMRNASSFSQTRTRAWNGWAMCSEKLREAGAWEEIASVLDIGCGNLRFEAFLAEQLESSPELWAVDNCSALLPRTHDIHYQELDIIGTLVEKESLAEIIDAPQCSLVCAFGLMHHVPGNSSRKALLESMVEKALPGAFIILSFWQFMKDARIARNAKDVTRDALERYPQLALDENDYLLGWQNSTEALRYCHNFNAVQIDELIASINGTAMPIARFEADGKSDDLNAYLILQKPRSPLFG